MVLRAMAVLGWVLAWTVPAAAQSDTDWWRRDRDPAVRQLDMDPAVQKLFGEALRAGLIRIRLDADDANAILQPLVEARIVPPIRERQRVKRRRSQSLVTISNQRNRVMRLFRALHAEFEIQDLRRRGVPLFLDGDPPPPPWPPAISAWLNLRGQADHSNWPTSRRRLPEPAKEPEALRWAGPMRIASTGSHDYDAIVGEVLAQMRADNPRLPLDAQSFPVPIEQANMLLDPGLITCPLVQPCGPQPPGVSGEPKDTFIDPVWMELRPLYVFGAIRDEQWVPDAPIYRIPAQSGGGLVPVSYRPFAWVRTDGRGHIGTAYCIGIAGIGTKGTKFGENNQRVPVPREEVADTARACLSAAMGAASQWSRGWVGEFQYSEDRSLDQRAGLAALYGSGNAPE